MAEQYAGWYPDPSGDASKLRYWDGSQWTNHYSDAHQTPLPTPPFAQTTSEQQPPSSAREPQTGDPQVVIKETIFTNSAGQQVHYDQVYVQSSTQPYPMDGSKQTIRLIAFILNLISILSVFWLIIPLAWMIPMTVHSWGLYKGTRRNTVGFSVCVIIFLNVISGILLLVSGEE